MQNPTMPVFTQEEVSQPPKVAVIIPAYKAEDSLEKVLAAIPDWIGCIIVVNDQSPDRTGEVDARAAAADARVVVVHHQTNQGVGGAMLSGYQKARELGMQVAVKMDSDDQMDPAYLADLIDPILNGKADYTKGNRFLHQAQLNTMPLRRRIGNLGLSFITKMASGYWNLFDPTNGFTALNLEILPFLNPERIDRRYFFETSLLIELGLNRAVVRDVSIPARYPGSLSSLSETRSFFEFPPKLLAGTLRRVMYLYFLRDFSAVSLFLVSSLVCILFGTIWGAVQWSIASRLGVPASTGTVMIAVLPVILGFQFLLQAMVMDVQNVPVNPLNRPDVR